MFCTELKKFEVHNVLGDNNCRAWLNLAAVSCALQVETNIIDSFYIQRAGHNSHCCCSWGHTHTQTLHFCSNCTSQTGLQVMQATHLADLLI
jgi:hypothetical protein